MEDFIYPEDPTPPNIAPPTPQPQWEQFSLALAADPAFSALAAVQPGIFTMLAVSLLAAKTRDMAPFLSAWSMATSSGLVTQEMAENVVALAIASDLPEYFVINVTIP